MPLRRTLLLLALFPVAACQSHLGARSNKLDSYSGDPARVLVVVGNRLLPGASNERFQGAIVERLALCGSAAEVVAPAARNGLALDDAAEGRLAMTAALNARTAAFRPDAVMLFQARAAQIEERRVNGIPSGRRVAGMEYSLDLLDVAGKRTVYRASASFALPPFAAANQGAELARLLVDRLAQDGVFTHCPPPTAVPNSGPGDGR